VEDPLKPEPGAQNETAGDLCHTVLSLQHSDQWIMGSGPGQQKTSVPLCWLPPERRESDSIHAVSGSTIVVFARTGAITILDFSAMLTMLDRAGVRPM
jgi:hypothetical protein